ncbi:unnamed protein product, partial [Discosporangium mesarthrocarpum]
GDDNGFRTDEEGGHHGGQPPLSHSRSATAHRPARVDTPLRIEPPSSFNAPARPVEPTREQHIKATAFSPAAFSMRKCQIMSAQSNKEGQGGSRIGGGGGAAALVQRLRQRQEPTMRTHKENQAPLRTAMSDYNMLAFSSQRSGRLETEGLSYYSTGVMLDSMGQYARALESYKKFLVVCKNLKDKLIEGLCNNCMGVNCMLMACPPGSSAQAGRLSPQAARSLERAVDFHTNHLNLADEAGLCIAHSNLGLCHGLLGRYVQAARHHQEALRMALQMQSISSQSIAVGNLGLLAMRQGDKAIAHACLEQHLQLVQQMGDYQGEINAWTMMAELAGREGESSTAGSAEGGMGMLGDSVGEDWDNRKEAGGGKDVTRVLYCLEQASSLAKFHGEVSTLKRVHCDMGVAKGSATIEEYFKDIEDFATTGYT